MVWNECQGEQHIRSISGILFRLAENQEQVATRSYVDTLDEQALLEDMLERVKPDYPEDMRISVIPNSDFGVIRSPVSHSFS